MKSVLAALFLVLVHKDPDQRSRTVIDARWRKAESSAAASSSSATAGSSTGRTKGFRILSLGRW